MSVNEITLLVWKSVRWFT